MTKFQNLKIEINDQQPLDEVVMELDRLGYKKKGWIGYRDVKFITANLKGFFTDHGLEFWLMFGEETTLSDLNNME